MTLLEKNELAVRTTGPHHFMITNGIISRRILHAYNRGNILRVNERKSSCGLVVDRLSSIGHVPERWILI